MMLQKAVKQSAQNVKYILIINLVYNLLNLIMFGLCIWSLKMSTKPPPFKHDEYIFNEEALLM